MTQSPEISPLSPILSLLGQEARPPGPLFHLLGPDQAAAPLLDLLRASLEKQGARLLVCEPTRSDGPYHAIGRFLGELLRSAPPSGVSAEISAAELKGPVELLSFYLGFSHGLSPLETVLRAASLLEKKLDLGSTSEITALFSRYRHQRLSLLRDLLLACLDTRSLVLFVEPERLDPGSRELFLSLIRSLGEELSSALAAPLFAWMSPCSTPASSGFLKRLGLARETAAVDELLLDLSPLLPEPAVDWRHRLHDGVLSPMVRHILEAASIWGASFPVEPVLAMAGALEPAGYDTYQHLLRDGAFLEEKTSQSSIGPRARFTDPRLADELVERMTLASQVRLHAEAARWCAGRLSRLIREIAALPRDLSTIGLLHEMCVHLVNLSMRQFEHLARSAQPLQAATVMVECRQRLEEIVREQERASLSEPTRLQDPRQRHLLLTLSSSVAQKLEALLGSSLWPSEHQELQSLISTFHLADFLFLEERDWPRRAEQSLLLLSPLQSAPDPRGVEIRLAILLASVTFRDRRLPQGRRLAKRILGYLKGGLMDPLHRQELERRVGVWPDLAPVREIRALLGILPTDPAEPSPLPSLDDARLPLRDGEARQEAPTQGAPPSTEQDPSDDDDLDFDDLELELVPEPELPDIEEALALEEEAERALQAGLSSMSPEVSEAWLERCLDLLRKVPDAPIRRLPVIEAAIRLWREQAEAAELASDAASQAWSRWADHRQALSRALRENGDTARADIIDLELLHFFASTPEDDFESRLRLDLLTRESLGLAMERQDVEQAARLLTLTHERLAKAESLGTLAPESRPLRAWCDELRLELEAELRKTGETWLLPERPAPSTPAPAPEAPLEEAQAPAQEADAATPAPRTPGRRKSKKGSGRHNS